MIGIVSKIYLKGAVTNLVLISVPVNVKTASRLGFKDMKCAAVQVWCEQNIKD